MGPTLTADYLIRGAGAAGMAFADTILAETDATIVMVDRNDRPGGHWLSAYPFVRLHQPSTYYGVPSTPLGTGAVDTTGLNAGYLELASGQEVVDYFDRVMRERFLASGRVRFLSASDLADDGVVTSRTTGERTVVRARRFVDGTHSRMAIPATSPPRYSVAPDVACVPVNDLPRRALEFDDVVIVGAGKTAMDACTWLLGNGFDPDRIRWIVPRDSWVLDRGRYQTGLDHFARRCQSLADQVEALATADSARDVFTRLEASGELHRLDPDVEPEAYHCAILSELERAELRRIEGVIRLGRVTAIEAHRIVLEHGEVPTSGRTLHVDCSAAGIPTVAAEPIFAGDRITLQWVRVCSPTFSAAMIGFVEATFGEEATKNRICAPIPPATVPEDWLRMMRIDLASRAIWNEHPEIGAWLATCRLDVFSPTMHAGGAADAEAMAHLGRYLEHVQPARDALDRLLDPALAVA